MGRGGPARGGLGGDGGVSRAGLAGGRAAVCGFGAGVSGVGRTLGSVGRVRGGRLSAHRGAGVRFERRRHEPAGEYLRCSSVERSQSNSCNNSRIAAFTSTDTSCRSGFAGKTNHLRGGTPRLILKCSGANHDGVSPHVKDGRGRGTYAGAAPLSAAADGSDRNGAFDHEIEKSSKRALDPIVYAGFRAGGQIVRRAVRIVRVAADLFSV